MSLQRWNILYMHLDFMTCGRNYLSIYVGDSALDDTQNEKSHNDPFESHSRRKGRYPPGYAEQGMQKENAPRTSTISLKFALNHGSKRKTSTLISPFPNCCLTFCILELKAK